MRQDNQSTAPTLLETIQTVIDSNLIDMHVSLPAKIVTYDPATQFASVKIQLMFSYENGSKLAWPVIPNVPVKHPRANGGKSYIHMPLVADDDVMLVVCERSLDNWKTQGGMTDPMDRRKFNITDCYALIGGSALPSAFTVQNPKAIEIQNGAQTNLQVLPGGQYKIQGGSSDELISIISDFMKLIAGAFTTTILGPEKLINPQDPGFVQIQQRLNAFKAG